MSWKYSYTDLISPFDTLTIRLSPPFFNPLPPHTSPPLSTSPPSPSPHNPPTTPLFRPSQPSRLRKKWEGLDVCEQFSLEQMVKATNNWSKDNVLGKGGFGIVYKGYSPRGHLWTIKRSKIMTNDFETEVRHMSLLAACLSFFLLESM
ncbi:unnamed protein product [Closterium sp. NIES-53]